MNPDVNGVIVVEMFNDPPQPYKIWFADSKKCLGCGNKVVLDFANLPLAEHFQAGFATTLDDVLRHSDVPVFYSYEKPQ